MRRPRVVARRFIQEYPKAEGDHRDAAKSLVTLLHDMLDPLPIGIDAIAGRPKSQASIVQKVIRKEYGRPARQMTDLVAARVVTYYSPDVDVVVAELQNRLDIDASLSVDKRSALTLSEFGYRSVHLIGLAPPPEVTRYPSLNGRRFEIQVRSLLEHSWAEIEHQVVYKSGVIYPEPFRRRFAALAAMIEMVDSAFAEMRDEEPRMRNRYAARYRAGDDQDTQVDASRLPALMEAEYPMNPGWRLGATSAAITPDMAARLSQALALAGASTARAIKASLSDRSVRRRVASYAATTGRAADEVSHAAILLIAIGSIDAELLGDCFPLEAKNPDLVAVLGLAV